MNFSTKKRPRKDAWRELQKDLDERERLEEENTAKFKRLDQLKARTALGNALAKRACGCATSVLDAGSIVVR